VTHSSSSSPNSTGPTTRSPAAWLVLAGFLGATYGVALLGSLATRSSVQSWYDEADKPPLTPPSWVFGPVWTTLYGLIAVAAWLAWRRRGEHPAVTTGLRLWWVQLALNLAWTPVFFGLQWLWPGLAIIVALDVLVVLVILRFRRVSWPAALLLVPYLLWLCFATWLNLGVAWLN
jgi:benzodiazapine receptor